MLKAYQAPSEKTSTFFLIKMVGKLAFKIFKCRAICSVLVLEIKEDF